jgi:hypothetical protein
MLVTLVVGALISCGGSGGNTATGGSGGRADGGGGTGGQAADASPGPASGLSLRFVNTLLPSGTTGPTLDLYDGTWTPLVTGLAYGAVSGYVVPRFTAAGSTSLLVIALPAGSPVTDAADEGVVWSGVDDGSHAQLTLLLAQIGPASSPDAGALAGSGTAIFIEKGSDGYGNAGPLAPPPPTGQGEFLASTVPIDVTPTPFDASSYEYFFVDDSCTLPLNGDPNQAGTPYLFALPTATPKSFFALYPAAPGTHQLSVVAWTDGVLPTCAQLTARQGATSATVTAGQQILAFVYGSSLTDLHLVTAPIAP